jgi:hypothetical protein
MRKVKLKNGTIMQFPEGTPEDVIEKAVKKVSPSEFSDQIRSKDIKAIAKMLEDTVKRISPPRVSEEARIRDLKQIAKDMTTDQKDFFSPAVGKQTMTLQSAIKDLQSVVKSLVVMVDNQSRAHEKAHSELVSALNEMTKAYSAPKTIKRDKDGKPTGIS